MKGGEKVKSEKTAKALSHIDDSLIEEADESRIICERIRVRRTVRLCGLAACLVLIVGIFALVNNGNDVLFNGSILDSTPVELTVNTPRSAASPADASALECVEFALEFKNTTQIQCEEAEISVRAGKGGQVTEGDSYTVKGNVTVRVFVPEKDLSCVIRTDNGSDIVLKKDPATCSWYINLENN